MREWSWVAAVVCASAAAHADPAVISFDEAVRRAVTANATVAQARAQVARADALVREARAALIPSVTVNGTYLRLDSDRVLNDRVIAGADQFAANLSVSVPIYNARSWYGLSRAEDSAELARASAVDARRAVGAATARTWVAVSGQHRALATAERARDNAIAHRDFARQRLAAGIGNRLDVVRAEQDIAQSQLAVLSQGAALVRLQEALGVLVGEDGPRDATEDATPGAAPEVSAALRDVARRADVQAALTRARNAQRAVDGGWTDYVPTLGALFQPFYQNPPTLTQPLTGWQAQVVLSWTLFDGGLRYGVARERRALRDEAQAALDGALRQARSEVRTAAAAIVSAAARAESAHEAARLAEEARTLADAAWRAGVTGNLEVIDAQRRARDADAVANMTDDDLRAAQLELLLAAGRFPPAP